MTAAAHGTKTGFFGRFDEAVFGLIYGAIMVLSILMAAGDHPESPLKTAAVLFGSLLAITLAKSFAEFLAHGVETGDRLERSAWRKAWSHSYPTLAVANVPTLLCLAAAFSWLTIETAVMLSQVLCIALLILLGARVGWVIDGRPLPALLGALFAGGIGMALAILKVLIH